jgi:two-component system chemotaxis sensor kinase CheA
MVGWKEASTIAHAMEDRLSECRDQGAFPSELADPMLRAMDALRRTIAGETGQAASVIEELGDGAPATDGPAAPPKAEAGTTEAAPHENGPPSAPESRSIRVASEKVDRMLDAVGETVLHHRRLDHLLGEQVDVDDEVADEELDVGERLLGELQESVIGMRTLPLSSITAPFPRAVRDLATAEGKEVGLVITGAETQLDRVILEGISEMITHLLRNSVAHGIEDPDEREKAGKPREGTVELRAEQRGDLVSIEVADDGRGVSPELLAQGERAGSLADVLGAAGFSTAEQVSDVAGRGVGLDAVKEHVEGLGGTLEVRSEPGKGIEVGLLLPLTLAVLEVLMCERGGQPFGVPLASVREVIAVKETVSLGGKPSVELRGESIPLRDLAAMIGAAAPELPPEPSALVLGTGGRQVAVACDEVVGDQEEVVKSLGPLLAGVRGYLGAAILGDGRVALVLDPNHLIKMPTARSPGTSPIVESEEQLAQKILVVDDQFTVRELQRSILETAGYRVETARDGREALERITADDDIDAVVSDVQMPEMDGLELLRAIRQDGDHESLPVVLVTAMSGDEDKRRGAEEGADAYIVKEEFDQQTLLDTIRRLLGH